MISQFSDDNFQHLCNELAAKEPVFKAILDQHSYPPMWTRKASFATLIHIMLEQQVSLASALAAFNKLKARLGTITPAKLLALTDEELKACYFSRQKIVYARHLAQHLIEKKIILQQLHTAHDEEVRVILKQVKGIGDWTADVYMMFALQRTDIFPVGDLAMVNALKEVKGLPAHTTKDDILLLAEAWRPYRSIAAMFLWHYYLKCLVRRKRSTPVR